MSRRKKKRPFASNNSENVVPLPKSIKRTITPSELLHTRPPGMPKAAWPSDTDEFMRYPETPDSRGSSKKRCKKRPMVTKLQPLPRQSTGGKERDPRLLYSFFRNFLEDDCVTFKDNIDLETHSRVSGAVVTDKTVQEITELIPHLKVLNLSGCSDVTDNGLIQIAHHCPNLREIAMRRCHQITLIGLRQIGSICERLETIDMSHCPQVNNESIKAIAANCGQIRQLVFQNCDGISDEGISELARCCKLLEHLNVSECRRVGEFGDSALIELGRTCTKLKVLDLFGCKHVRDRGLQSVARGCRNLQILKLSGCHEVSGKAIQALARNCRHLQTLSLAGCGKTRNEDITLLARSCRQLAWLDISGSPKISATGVQELAQYCDQLKYLSLANCKSVGDDVLNALGFHARALTTLILANCPKLTQSGVLKLVRRCKKLFSLDISDCPNLGKRFLQQIINEQEFVEWAHNYFGFQPRKNLAEIWQRKELRNLERTSATKIQAHVRGMQARNRVWNLRIKAISTTTLPKIQARIRGHLTRKRLERELPNKLHIQMCLVIQRVFRGYLGRKKAKRKARLRLIQNSETEAALIFQRVYRNYRRRKRMAAINEEKRRRQQMELRRQALLEVAAIKVQQAYRGHKGRADAGMMRAYRHKLMEDRKRRVEAATMIQRLARGHGGRNMRKRLLEAIAQEREREESAIKLQSTFRARKGRHLARKQSENKVQKTRDQAAMMIQKYWRGTKERHVGVMMLSLMRLRIRENRAACLIQRVFRGYMSRGLFKALKTTMTRRRVEKKSVEAIQRIYRGHKGREQFEIQKELRKLEVHAKPLFKRLRQLEAKHAESARKLAETKSSFEEETKDEVLLTQELDKVYQIKTKFHDSARITGTSQRYLTAFLQVQLADQLREKRAKIAVESQNIEAMTDARRQLDKDIRVVKQQLKPLTEEVSHTTKALRNERLRTKVRREKVAALKIQKRFRGYRVRCAVAEGANYWVQLYNNEMESLYFYNTWTQDTRWTRPLAMEIFGDTVVGYTDEANVVQGETKWLKCNDPDTGIDYYFNNDTGETRWDRPSEAGSAREWLEQQDPQTLTARSAKLRDIGTWEEYVDAETGTVYYYNQDTGESRWSLSPRSAHGGQDTGRRSIQSVGTGRRSTKWQHQYGFEYNETNQLVRVERERSSWTKEFDSDSGLDYYYNHLTEECRWDVPEDYTSPSAPNTSRSWFENQDKDALTARSVKKRDIGAWAELVDEESGNTYYYNATTQESRWSLSPRSARPPIEENPIPEELRQMMEDLELKKVDYKGREDHVAWMQESVEEKDWIKASGFAEQIQERQIHGVEPEQVVESSDIEEEVEAEVIVDEVEPEVVDEIQEVVVPPEAIPPVAEAEVEEPVDEIEGVVVPPEEIPQVVEAGVDEPFDEAEVEEEVDVLIPPEEIPEAQVEEPESFGEDIKKEMSADDPEAWIQLDDGQGNIYYYNQVTEESTWDAPAFKAQAGNILMERYGDGEENQSMTEVVSRAFADFDVDGTGYMDKTELGALVASLGSPMDDNQLDAGMNSFDDSGDGQISYQEFLTWWSSGTEEEVVAEEATSGNDWEAVVDEDGNTYYYNLVTGETSWELPEQQEYNYDEQYQEYDYSEQQYDYQEDQSYDEQQQQQ